MARIVFESEMSVPPTKVVEALSSQEGIASWWTDQVELDGGPGSTMTLRFPVAPVPFHLRVDEVTERIVRWTSVGDFPPHWVDTTVTWTLAPSESCGTRVHFDHDGWASDDGAFPSSALTWAQLQGTLASYVETGEPTPLFRRE